MGKKIVDKNALSVRMKNYEDCYSIRIPARSYIILRLDGKNFSKYTKMFTKPFDDILSNVIDVSTIELCKELHPKFAYTQSDEISLLFTDIDNVSAETIYDGKIQKLISIAASKFTAAFNKNMLKILYSLSPNPEEMIQKISMGTLNEIQAVFDARVFVIPDYREVSNYFVWRQQDSTRNSVSMAADSVYSHQQLRGKSSSEKQELLFQKGINWNDYKVKYKRGIVIRKYQVEKLAEDNKGKDVIRSTWLPDYKTPIFTEDKEYLRNLIPVVHLLNKE